MNKYEELQEMAVQDNVNVISYRFESKRIKGLYCDRTVALSSALADTSEKTCVLAEELGHHHTTAGNILDQQDVSNRKQERRARIWAYDHLVNLFGIIRAHNAGCQNTFEMAEYLGITEEFLKDALDAYRSKYGTGVRAGEYWIIFEPGLAVVKITETW